MKRVLLDSNIYGKVIESRQEEIIREALNKDDFESYNAFIREIRRLLN